MNRLSLLAGCLSIVLAGCNISATEPAPTATATLPPSVTPRPSPFPTSTALPVSITVVVKSELANCRFGPGTVFLTVNEFKLGQRLHAVGRSDPSAWWYVDDPGNPAGHCWISADVTEAQGDANEIEIVQAPAASVTNIKLRVEPSRVVVNCNEFPQTVFFEAQITTNGPTLFTWRWETSIGVTSDEGTLVFEEAGTQVINDYYQINAPNEYWVRLHVLTPNERFEQVNFPVICTP